MATGGKKRQAAVVAGMEPLAPLSKKELAALRQAERARREAAAPPKVKRARELYRSVAEVSTTAAAADEAAASAAASAAIPAHLAARGVTDVLSEGQIRAMLRADEPLAPEGWRDRWSREWRRLDHVLGLVCDPRDTRGKKHPLRSVLAIMVLASLCGCDDAENAYWWAISQRPWLEEFLELPHGIPSQDTILRVMSIIDPRQLELALINWSEAFVDPAAGRQLVADGQTLRRGGQGLDGLGNVHNLHVIEAQSGIVLAKRSVDEKSNEIKAIPAVLSLLDIRSALVSFDAMGCQTGIAEQIRAKEADWLFGLKSNQLSLFTQVQAAFTAALATGSRPQDVPPPPTVSAPDKQQSAGHGRVETRTVWVMHRSSQPAAFDRWLPDAARFAGIETLIMVQSERLSTKTGDASTETRYYISSRHLTAAEAGQAVRRHWHIENKLHYVLDVTFGADQCRVRIDNAATNYACLRQFAINIARRHASDKFTISRRRKMAGLFPLYRDFLLASL